MQLGRAAALPRSVRCSQEWPRRQSHRPLRRNWPARPNHSLRRATDAPAHNASLTTFTTLLFTHPTITIHGPTAPVLPALTNQRLNPRPTFSAPVTTPAAVRSAAASPAVA